MKNALNRRELLGSMASLAAFPEPLNTMETSANQRPNILLIITDDQGYGDIRANGNPVAITPNLDALHSESVRFTRFHVSPTCAPTRCALLTGKHEFRSGVTHTIYERERMSLKAVTLPQLLRNAGYATGIFGKWHLGDEPAYRPDKRGYDEVYIHGGGGIGQTYVGSCGDAPGNTYFNPALLHNGRFVKTKGYCADLFFQRASEWIGSVYQTRPFFAHIATNTPHSPLQCPPEYEKLYTDRVGKDMTKQQAAFYGMITNIDDNVGRMMQRLKTLGIERDTLVIFMSDNGGTEGVRLYNAGMRSGKNTPYEGGTRALSLWRWKSKFRQGDVDALTAHIDVLPTLAELTKVSIPKKLSLEGRSLVPLLQNPDVAWKDRYLVTHIGRWAKGKASDSQYSGCAIRSNRFRFINNRELYDISEDPGEKQNVLEKHPDVVADMRRYYDRWWKETLPHLENEEAVGPEVNPFKAEYWQQFGKDSP